MMDSNEVKPEGKKCHRRFCWKFPLIILAVLLVKSVVVFYLWNALVPELFHGPVLSFYQALGLLILAKVLFGSRFGRGGHHGPPWRRHWMSNMTDEEREKLRGEFRRRCGFGHGEDKA